LEQQDRHGRQRAFDGDGTGTTKKWYELDVTSFLKSEKAAGRNVVTLVLKNRRSRTRSWSSTATTQRRTNRSS
jgi:hypothetical protein